MKKLLGIALLVSGCVSTGEFKKDKDQLSGQIKALELYSQRNAEVTCTIFQQQCVFINTLQVVEGSKTNPKLRSVTPEQIAQFCAQNGAECLNYIKSPKQPVTGYPKKSNPDKD
jgi:hypothetical protein